jgi:predicted nucleic acid-binding protein
MILYVESNFILEIVFQQEQADSAEALLQLGEERKIEIAFPTFSLIEPYWTIKHRGEQREGLCEELNRELNQLRRSESHKDLVLNLESARKTMLELERHNLSSLKSTTLRVLSIGKAIEIGQEVFAGALVHQSRYGLSLLDAVVYSAVANDLARRGDPSPKCFVSKDNKAFFDPGIIAELSSHNCRYISSFEDALNFIRSQTK